MKIRVCWPSPDAVCLQGGCIYCEDYRPRLVSSVERYAKRHGMEADLATGLAYGNRTVKEEN